MNRSGNDPIIMQTEMTNQTCNYEMMEHFSPSITIIKCQFQDGN
jgi:hypothetical protein